MTFVPPTSSEVLVVIKFFCTKGFLATEIHQEFNNQTDKIVEQVNETLRNDRQLTKSALTDEFPHVGCNPIYTIATEKLEFPKL